MEPTEKKRSISQHVLQKQPVKWFSVHSRKGKKSVPLCECQLDDQTAFHILTSCEKVDADIREVIILILLLGNDVALADALAADNISLLNCSRDELFVQQCLKALKTSSLQLRTRITLWKKGQMCGQPKP